MSLDIEERELPMIQSGLVDTCFEEAQYEFGIDVLYGLRSTRYKPPPLHIRQLIYIALYPPPPPKQGLDTNELPELPDAPPSPQKICLKKEDLWPKQSARQKALALLRSYVGINSPQSFMRAFPFYPYVNEAGTNDVNPFGNENVDGKFHDDNTPLREEILKFQSLKDCWGCLKERFSKRSPQDSASSSKRQTNLDYGTSGQFVGPYAWPVLEWLISVFEKDQELQQVNGGMPFSPLLLIQIPPPKMRRGPRIGIEIPVEILKECFAPSPNLIVSNSSMDFNYTIPEKRQELGTRLLSLLFNLTRTNPPFLSSSQLTNTLAITFRSFELNALHSFFSSLSLDQAVFKLNILEHLLTKNEERTTAPKAKARAKPRAKGADQTHVESAPKDAGSVEGAYIVPSLARFTSLISSRPSSEEDADLMALKKYHLVSALFQARDGISLTAYDEAVKTRSLRKSIEEGFGETQGVACMYNRSASSIVQTWEKQI